MSFVTLPARENHSTRCDRVRVTSVTLIRCETLSSVVALEFFAGLRVTPDDHLLRSSVLPRFTFRFAR